MSQRSFPGAAGQPVRGLEVDHTGGVGILGYFIPLTSAPTRAPCFLLGEHQSPWVHFLELWWPVLLFRKMRFFPVQPSISMEIETSFLRGPLLTSSSDIRAGESVPGLCSEQRGYIYPVSQQVVPKKPLHWTLWPQNVKLPAILNSPGLAWMSREQADFFIPGTNKNLSNCFFLFLSSSFFFSFNILFCLCESSKC